MFVKIGRVMGDSPPSEGINGNHALAGPPLITPFMLVFLVTDIAALYVTATSYLAIHLFGAIFFTAAATGIFTAAISWVLPAAFLALLLFAAILLVKALMQPPPPAREGPGTGIAVEPR
ncbi:MAG: hypothetical protein LBC42_00290 [Puniceicoccales bacterium]|jgi:hypothetical protein|nr:hypothetical protein [Puniceicoccales bacterium]